MPISGAIGWRDRANQAFAFPGKSVPVISAILPSACGLGRQYDSKGVAVTLAAHILTPADSALLRRYARQHDQDAFALLAHRHVDRIYAAALRMTRDGGLAQDVTQGVLLALSRKADHLATRDALGGWLFEATRHAAKMLL